MERRAFTEKNSILKDKTPAIQSNKKAPFLLLSSSLGDRFIRISEKYKKSTDIKMTDRQKVNMSTV